jgi:hypothetical protein
VLRHLDIVKLVEGEIAVGGIENRDDQAHSGRLNQTRDGHASEPWALRPSSSR